jgi:lactobin A/cerein 7B family class IIb bacteriocin
LLQGVVALDQYATLTEKEMMVIEGGLVHVGHVVKAVGLAYAAGYAIGSFIGNVLNNIELIRKRRSDEKTNKVSVKSVIRFHDLSESDLQEINGGVAPLVVIGGIIVVGFVIGAVNGCSNAKKKWFQFYPGDDRYLDGLDARF